MRFLRRRSRDAAEFGALHAERPIAFRARVVGVMVAAALQLAACALQLPGGKGEARHVLIVGLGWVTVHDQEKTSVVATSLHALGVTVTDRPGVRFGAGYASSQVVSVAEDAPDVVVEVSRRPGGPLRVQSRSCTAEEHSDPKLEVHP